MRGSDQGNVAIDTVRPKRDFSVDVLHIFVLCGFAIAQPLFNLLGRNAEFFVVRRSQPVDVILLILILCVLFPALLAAAEAAAGLLGQRVREGIHGVLVAFLVAGVALQVLKRVSDTSGAYLVAGAALLGLAFSVGYLRFLPFRFYLTVLSPAVLLFPGLFLFHSPVSKVVFPRENPLIAVTKVNATTPIVMVIFDELPLTSLMDEHHQIDPIRYPNFAALARHSTWFRNATTVGDGSAFAIPAILTGNYPGSPRLPTAADYPHNIFTLLGGSYKLKVFGPITDLCPDDMCEKERESMAERMSFLISDLSIVYLHVLLPEDLSAGLPPVTQNWTNFAGGAAKGTDNAHREAWPQRLLEGLREDRVRHFTEFVNAIDRVPQPTLYFLHLELPHGPNIYLPSGKIYRIDKSGLVGLLPNGKWGNDEFAVAQNYQRHLLQVSFVDALLGTLLARLKAVSLYDRSLIVITSDHGVSFIPNQNRRGVNKENFQDIMPIPLFIKAPNQHEEIVSDLNVETIDILPSVADILGIDLPWPTDGSSAFNNSAPERKTKTVYYPKMVFDSVALEARYTSLETKLTWFSSGTNPDGLLRIGPYSELVGRQVDDVGVMGEATDRSGLDRPALFTDVAPESDFVPAYISGYVRSDQEAGAPFNLAIAINGTIRATTQTFTFRAQGNTRKWSAIVDEASFRAGDNDIEVFIISSSGGQPILKRSYAPVKPQHYLNIALGAKWVWGVRESGFNNQEWWGEKPVRWTNGEAKLVIPVEEDNPPKALRVALASTGPKGTKLKVLVNGHEIFDQRIAAGGWSETLSLGQRLLGREITIELVSHTFVPMEVNERSRDPRTLGVAVKGITLLDIDPPLQP
jgi:hypothetical protein